MSLPGRPAAPGPEADSIDLTTPAVPDSPALPHERDQAIGATGGTPSRRVRQGHDDVERGVQDTSRAPEAGRAYDKLKKK